MLDLEALYFEWLLTRLDPDGVTEEVAYTCSLLHHCPFLRRVGRDINRAIDGANLRKTFLTEFDESDFDPHVTNDLMMHECTWLEMLVALATHLDFLYDGGTEGRFTEMVENLELGEFMRFGYHHEDDDQEEVYEVTSNFDNNDFDRNGHGGLFPLAKLDHPDQREVEIWDQQAAYFREKLEGVLWISTT